MLKKSLIAVGILTAITLALVYPMVYAVQGSGGGALFWDASEAFLFISENSYGARMNYLRYALEPLLVGMGVVHATGAESCSKTLVIRVADKKVQRYDTDLYRYAEESGCSFQFELFRGQIYAVSWPRLLKWSGTRFERTTPEEYGAYATALSGGKTVSLHPWEFDNVDGWSMRALGQTPPKYDLVLNGQPVTIVYSGETWPPKPLSVDLMRPGQAPERIWEFDGRAHRVSKAEYEHTFEKR